VSFSPGWETSGSMVRKCTLRAAIRRQPRHKLSETLVLGMGQGQQKTFNFYLNCVCFVSWTVLPFSSPASEFLFIKLQHSVLTAETNTCYGGKFIRTPLNISWIVWGFSLYHTASLHPHCRWAEVLNKIQGPLDEEARLCKENSPAT